MTRLTDPFLRSLVSTISGMLIGAGLGMSFGRITAYIINKGA